jgi:peptide/nickel transport system ATP-binding protein
METVRIFKTDGLTVSTIESDYGSHQIVHDINIEVRRGEILSLIGESGSGKTTIALSAMGYCKPGLWFSGGSADLVGMKVTAMTPQALRSVRGNNVTYMAQSAAATFNPALTIGYQVTEAAIVHGNTTPKAAHSKALSLFHALKLPDPELIGSRYPHEVSGGQLQRLMAAMALCGDPDLVILDEPTTALDVTTQIEVLTAIKSVISNSNIAAIYVTHDLSVVAQVATRVAVIHEGEVIEQGTVEEIIAGGQHAYTRQLIQAAARNLNETAASPSKEEPGKPPAVLRVENLYAGYGPAAPVLDDIELTVRRGETLAIIGESGCGKSTLVRVVAGLHPATKGRVILGGEVVPAHHRQRTREQLSRIQFVHQMADTALNPRQTIGTILGRPLAFYHDMRGAERRERVGELLQMVELPVSFSDRYPRELSGGQKQRVNLARALAAEPEIILCDEVISALDSIVAANIISLLKRLQEETGIAFVFITHDLSAAATFAHDTIVLYGGHVVESGPTSRVLSPPYHPYTRLLIDSVPKLKVGWMEDIENSRDIGVGEAREIPFRDQGCPYYHRCPVAIETECPTKTPPRRYNDADDNHFCSCWHSFKELSSVSVLPPPSKN